MICAFCDKYVRSRLPKEYDTFMNDALSKIVVVI